MVNHQVSSADVTSHIAHDIIQQHVNDGSIREIDISGGHAQGDGDSLKVTRPTSAHIAAAAPASASTSMDSLSSATVTSVQSHQFPSHEVFFDSTTDRNEGVSEIHHTQHDRLPKQPLTSAATASASAIASTVSSMAPSGLSYGFSGGLEALFQEDPLGDLLNPNFAVLPSLAAVVPAAPGSNKQQQPHHLPSSLSSSTSTSSALSNLTVDISVGRDFNPLLSPTRHPTNSTSPSQRLPAKSALNAMMMAAAAVADNLTLSSSMTPKNASRGTDNAAIMQASAAASVYASLSESNMSNNFPQQSLPLPPTVSSKQKPPSNATPGGGPRRGRPPSKKSLPPNLLDSMGHLTPTAAAPGFTTPPQPSVKPKVPRGGSARGKLGYGRGGGAGALARPAALGRAASPATTASVSTPPPTHPGVVSAADAIINSIPVTLDIVSSAQSLQSTTPSVPWTTGQISAKPPKNKSNTASSTPTPANSSGRGGGRGRGRGGRGGRATSSLLGHATVPAPIELSPLNVSVEPDSVSPVVELAPAAEVSVTAASLQPQAAVEPAHNSPAKPATALVVSQLSSVVEPAVTEPPVVLETTATPPADSLPLSASTTASDSTTFSPEPMVDPYTVDGVNFAAAEPAGVAETDRLNTFLFSDEAFYQHKESVLPPLVGSVIIDSNHAAAADPASVPNPSSRLPHPGHSEEFMDVEEPPPSAEHHTKIQVTEQPQASTPIATPASTQASSDAGGGPGEAGGRLLEADEEDPECPLTPKNINAKYAKYVGTLHKDNSVVCNLNVKEHIAQFETPKSLPINAFDVVKHVIEAGGLKNISMTMLLQKLNVPLKTNAYAPRVKRWMNVNHVEGFIESLEPKDLSKLKEPPVTAETPSGSQVNSENSLPSPSSPNMPAIQLAPVVELPAVIPSPSAATNSRKRQRTSSTTKGGEPRRASISAGSVKKLKSSKSSTVPAPASATESFVAADLNNNSISAAASMMDVTADVLPDNNVSNNSSTELSMVVTTSPSPATNSVTTTTNTTSSGTVTATSAAARRRGSLAPVLQNSRWMAALYPSESQLLQEIDVCLLSSSELLAEIPQPPDETQHQQRALEPTKPQTKANQFEVSSRQADLASLKMQLTALNLLVRDHAVEYSVRRSRILPAAVEMEAEGDAAVYNAVVVVSEESLVSSHHKEQLDHATLPISHEANSPPLGQYLLIPAAAEPSFVDPNHMAVALYNSNSNDAEQKEQHDQHDQHEVLARLREQNERLKNSRSHMSQLLRQQRDLVESLRSRVVEPMGEAETTQWRTWAEEVLDVLAFFPRA